MCLHYFTALAHLLGKAEEKNAKCMPVVCRSQIFLNKATILEQLFHTKKDYFLGLESTPDQPDHSKDYAGYLLARHHGLK